MFDRIRKRKSGITTETASGPDGKRAYVIGDVHGRADLLQELLDRIRRHDAERGPAETHIIFLGDLIDRGPQSRDVIDILSRAPSEDQKFWFIKGNHEESLVRGLSGEPHLLSPWLKHGGYDTAESYGLDRGALIGQEESALEHLLMSAIPSSHVDFLASFHESIRFGDYLCVHAGIRPGVTFEQQDGKDLRWIRGEFLNSRENFGFVVVHGHTVVESVDYRPNRIAVDTGAYTTGRLSAIWIEGTELGDLTVEGAADLNFDASI